MRCLETGKAAFEKFWRQLTECLTTKQRIPNWTRDRGYVWEGDFNAFYRGGNAIECILEAGSILQVHRNDFEFLFNHWNAYITGRFPRYELRNGSRHTKYTISIFNKYRDLLPKS